MRRRKDGGDTGARLARHSLGERHAVTEAQLGLVVTAPLLSGFALLLLRMGALQRTGAFLAVAASVVIAAVLYAAQ